LLWPVNAIYIHSVLHQPVSVAGMVLMLYSGASFVGSLLGGWLYDRAGVLWVLLSGVFLSAVSIVIPAFFQSWWVYVAVMGAFGLTAAMPFPATNALAGHLWPEGGRRAFNFIYVANNLGVAIGTAIGGLLAEWSFHAVFYGIAISYAMYFCLVVFTYRPRLKVSIQASPKPANTVKHDRGGKTSLPWWTIILLLGGCVTSWMIYVQWQSSISVYMKTLGYSLSSYSLLWTLNGLMIFIGQPLISRIVKSVTRLSTHMLIGVVSFAIAYTLLIFLNQYVAFVLAMLIMTVGEMFMWPAVPAAIAQISPPERFGTLQGFVSGGATLGRMLGPVCGGYIYDSAGVHTLLVAAVLACLVPGIVYTIYRMVEPESNFVQTGESVSS
jgi:MFS family permease